jgi:hypothetical protein
MPRPLAAGAFSGLFFSEWEAIRVVQLAGKGWSKGRTPWEDRFRCPTAQDLTSHYRNRQLATLFDLAKEQLSSIAPFVRRISWQGVAWRWCFTWHDPSEPAGPDGLPRPRFYLVPHPDGPTVACPMTEEAFNNLPRRALGRTAREGLDQSRQIGDARWASWKVTNRTALAEVVAAVAMLHGRPANPAPSSRKASAERVAQRH